MVKGRIGRRPPTTSGRRELDDTLLHQALTAGAELPAVAGSVADQVRAVATAFFERDGADRFEVVPASSIDWSAWAVAPGALVFGAQAFGVAPELREQMIRMLELLLSTPLVRSGARLRRWEANGELGLPEPGKLEQAVAWRNGNAYFVSRNRDAGNQYLVLEYMPKGEPHPLGSAVVKVERRASPISEDAAREVLGRLGDDAPPWHHDAVDALADGTGITRAEAALLWAGLPALRSQAEDFLGEDVRSELGLSVAEARAARKLLRTIDPGRRLDVLAAGGSVPAALWDPIDGLAAARMVGAWNRLIGRRVPIPDELIADATRDLASPVPPAEALGMLAAPKTAPRLNTDGAWGFDARRDGRAVRTTSGNLVVTSGPARDEDASIGPTAAACDLLTLHTVAVYLPYLFAALPVGDHLRAQLPIAYELIKQRLANPDLWVTLGTNGYPEAEQHEVYASFPGQPLPAPVTGKVAPGAAMVRSGKTLTMYLRPKELVTATELARVRVHTAHFRFAGKVSPRDVIAYLRSDELARMMKRVTDTPVADDGWEQDPRQSAPAQVATAAQRLGVSAAAATLYLQMLVLLWPTPENIQTWNGWTAAEYDAAARELAKRDLVVAGTRERAGRGYFLPGGWEALPAPHPPMESWKVPLYADDRDDAGLPIARFERFVAYDAPHALYELAWARVESGDPPRAE
jgi:hypothetical protein